MSVERLWTNGKIITLDAEERIYREMYTSGERIVAVGDNLRPQFGSLERVEVVDLGGRTVVPGFMDCHLHFSTTALGLVDQRFNTVGSLAEMLEVVREGTRNVPEGQFYRGHVWDENSYPEGRGPNRWDLDSVAPDVPVFLVRVGGNVSAVNSKALQILDLPTNLPGIGRADSGEPNGLLSGDANFLAQILVHARLSVQERLSAYQSMGSFAASQGITTVHAVEGECYNQLVGDRSYPNTDVDFLLSQRPDIPLDLVIWDTQVVNLRADLERVKGLGLPRVGGDIFADGVLGVAWVPGVSRAAISEPYLDGDRSLGHLLLEDTVLTQLMERSLELGLQLSCHAVGDRAIGQFLSCFETALRRVPSRDTRPRIEHGILPTEEQMDRAAELGVVFSMQPAFEWQSGGPNGRYAQRLGPVRVRRTHPLRQLTDAGVVVAGGSDSPANVTHPLLGVHASVYHASDENRLTPTEALRVFTINAAWSAFEENDKGSLEPNKLADFVVLEGDPTEPGAEIKDIQVGQTVRRGKDVYRLQKREI